MALKGSRSESSSPLPVVWPASSSLSSRRSSRRWVPVCLHTSQALKTSRCSTEVLKCKSWPLSSRSISILRPTSSRTTEGPSVSGVMPTNGSCVTPLRRVGAEAECVAGLQDLGSHRPHRGASTRSTPRCCADPRGSSEDGPTSSSSAPARRTRSPRSQTASATISSWAPHPRSAKSAH